MDFKTTILNSKLRYSGASDIITRKRLLPVIQGMTEKKITTVVAGSGYGKSTLVNQALSSSTAPVIWYRLDRYDSDVQTFLYYLISGFRRYFFGIGELTLDTISKIHEPEKEYIRIVSVLINELESIVEEQTYIVLDDYHTITDSGIINPILEFFIEHLPRNIHLIIISRETPDIQLSLYKARRELLEVNETDLSFSLSEIRTFYSEIFSLELSDEVLTATQKRTGGWVSAMILIYHGMKEKLTNSSEISASDLQGTNRAVSAYIEENIYKYLPEDTRLFLLKTSILSQIPVELCNRLLGISNASDILEDLEARHLFTCSTNDDDATYVYHHFFQEFLQSRLSQVFNEHEIADLHIETARLMEEMQCEEEALRHYLEAGQIETACILLSKLSTILWSKGVQIIYSFISNSADIYRQETPWVVYLKAICAEYSGRHRKAVELFELAYSRFQDEGCSKGIVLCEGTLGYNYLHSGDPVKAENLLKHLVNSTDADTELAVSASGHLMEAYITLGRPEEANTCYANALSLSARITDERRRTSLRAFLYFMRGLCFVFTGEFQKTIASARKIREEVEGTGLVAQIAHYHLLTSLGSYFAGYFSDGLEHAGKGIELLREKRLSDFLDNSCSDYAWLLWAYGANSLNSGNIDDAVRYCDESLNLFQKADNKSAQATVLYTMAMICKLTGDRSGEFKSIESCKKIISGCGLIIQEGMTEAYTATSLLEDGTTTHALQLIKSASEKLSHSIFESARIKFLFARYYWLTGDKESAVLFAVDALKICESNSFDFWLLPEFPWIESLCVELYSRELQTSYLETIFTWLGNPALDAFRKTRDNSIRLIGQPDVSERPSLKVFCFGKFKLFQGETEIPVERWKSRRKAKTLFKYLVSVKDRGYQNKDVLMELLWPEEDPLKTSNRFHVTLSALRKILEPDLGKGMRSSYILSDSDSYQISLGHTGITDVDMFLHELASAEQAISTETMINHYLKAESLYTGDYFEEDAFENWCVQDRLSYRGKYLEILKKLITHYETQGKIERCIHFANRYLEFDQYSETIYQSLMSYYTTTGNRAMAVLTYEKCRDSIEKELDCPLSTEIKQFFDSLMSA